MAYELEFRVFRVPKSLALKYIRSNDMHETMESNVFSGKHVHVYKNGVYDHTKLKTPMHKHRLNNICIYDTSLALSTEKNITDSNRSGIESCQIRHKFRYSKMFDVWRLDMTFVYNETRKLNVGSNTIDTPKKTINDFEYDESIFELEYEYVPIRIGANIIAVVDAANANTTNDTTNDANTSPDSSPDSSRTGGSATAKPKLLLKRSLGNMSSVKNALIVSGVVNKDTGFPLPKLSESIPLPKLGAGLQKSKLQIQQDTTPHYDINALMHTMLGKLYKGAPVVGGFIETYVAWPMLYYMWCNRKAVRFNTDKVDNAFKMQYVPYSAVLNNAVTLDILSYSKLDHKKIKITPKIDGERYVIGVVNNVLYITSAGDVRTDALMFTFNHDNIIVEAEKVGDIFMIYDYISLAEMSYETRLEHATEFAKELNDMPSKYTFTVKHCKPLDTMFNSKLILDTASSTWLNTFGKPVPDRFKTDGYILIDERDRYYNSVFYKWKQSSQSTIDLLWNGKIWLSREGKDLVPFNTCISSISSYVAPGSYSNGVYELRYKDNAWHVVKQRFDKEKPNAKATVTSVAASIAWPVDITTTMSDSPAYFANFNQSVDVTKMREHNNREKDEIFALYRDMRHVVDIGTGRGQDVLKYVHNKVGNVTAIEKDVYAIIELIDRSANKLRLNVINRDFNLIKPLSVINEMPRMTVDAINISFAIHYFDMSLLKRFITCLIPADKPVMVGYTVFNDQRVKQFLRNGVWEKEGLRLRIEDNKLKCVLPFSGGVEYEENIFSTSDFIKSFEGYNVEVVMNKKFSPSNNSLSEYSELYDKVVLKISIPNRKKD